MWQAREHDPGLPWISPLYGDLHGLPPALIYVGDDETMHDDSIRYAEKASAAGVEVTFKVWKGMVQCFPLFSPLFPEAKQAMDEICAFIKTNTGKEQEPVYELEGVNHFQTGV